MIFGIGCDISKTSRFEKWLEGEDMIERFFNEKEMLPKPPSPTSLAHATQHYASRFSAKEAFSKALGTGIDFPLKDVYIEKEVSGKPVLKVEGQAREKIEKLTGLPFEKIKILVSLSHEKEYAMAMVVIEV